MTTKLPSIPTTTVRRFAGRLLTMAALPSDLQSGQVLQVGVKTIVTPEVRDHLRKWQVTLQRLAEGEVARATNPVNHKHELVAATVLQVWLQAGAGNLGHPSVRKQSWSWLGKVDSRIAMDVRQVVCGKQLADELAVVLAGQSQQWQGPTQLVLSDRPWEVQRCLASEHGVFAWCVPQGGTQVWEQAREAAPRVLLCSPPLTSWTVRNWLKLV